MSGTTTTVKWGIIGVGDVCEKKSGPAFQKANGSELVAVMRRSAERAQDFAERHGVARWYSTLDEILVDQSVTAWYIASPPGTHLEIALRCLEATGLPCYIEKPVARNLTETEQLVDAFRVRGVPLYSAYYRRGQERFHKAREIVRSGVLGTIASVSYRMVRRTTAKEFPTPSSSAAGGTARACSGWRFQAEHAGAGLLLDVGCHTLDILDFVVGPVSGVQGHAANLEGTCSVEDNVTMSFRIAPPRQPRAAVGTASWCFCGFEDQDLISIEGTHGVLSLSTFGNEPLRLRTREQRKESGSVEGTGAAASTEPEADVTEELFQFEAPQHVQQPLIQLVVDDLLGVGPAAPSRGDNAVRVARVLDEALQGYYAGRADHFWERAGSWPGRPSVQLDADAVVDRAKVLVDQLYTEAGVDDTHGTLHVFKVLQNLDNALVAAARQEGEGDGAHRVIPASRKLACRLAALLHDADDKKYFPRTCKTYANANEIALAAGATPDVAKDMLRMIGWVSCSSNGNSCPEEAKREPELLWPRWADRLEAVGEIGVARCYLYNVHKGDPLCTASSPRPKTVEEAFAIASPERFEQYQSSGGHSDSMIDHYYDKLLSVARPPPEIVHNSFLEAAALESAAPLLKICLNYSETGRVNIAEIEALVTRHGLSLA